MRRAITGWHWAGVAVFGVLGNAAAPCAAVGVGPDVWLPIAGVALLGLVGVAVSATVRLYAVDRCRPLSVRQDARDWTCPHGYRWRFVDSVLGWMRAGGPV